MQKQQEEPSRVLLVVGLFDAALFRQREQQSSTKYAKTIVLDPDLSRVPHDRPATVQIEGMVSDSSEPVKITTYNISWLRSANEPTNDLFDIWPGLKAVKSISGKRVSPKQLEKALGTHRYDMDLWIDFPGQELNIFSIIRSIGHLDRIREIRVRCGADVFFDGGHSSSTLREKIEDEFFDLIDLSNHDPDWPELTFIANRSEKRIFELQTELSTVNDQLSGLHQTNLKLGGKIQLLEDSAKRLTELNAKLEHEKVETATREAILKNDQAELEDKIDRLAKDLAARTSQNDGLQKDQKRLAILRKKYRKLYDQCAAISLEVDSIQSRSSIDTDTSSPSRKDELTSLFDRILARSTHTCPRIVYSFPGTRAVDLSWWRSFSPDAHILPGHSLTLARREVRKSRPGSEGLLFPSIVQACVDAVDRAGGDLLFSIFPRDTSTFADIEGPRALLVCHPMTAFLAHSSDQEEPAENFDEFCANLNAFLDDQSELVFFKDEMLDGSDPEEIQFLFENLKLDTVGQDFEKPKKAGSLNLLSSTPLGQDYFSSPAYRALCKRLGYDADRYIVPQPYSDLPQIPQRLDQLEEALTETEIESFSEFLNRSISVFGETELRSTGSLVKNQIETSLVNAAMNMSSDNTFLEKLDTFVEEQSEEVAALTLLATGSHFALNNHSIHAQNFVAEALVRVPQDNFPLLGMSVSLLAKMNQPATALGVLLSGCFSPQLEDTDLNEALRQVFSNQGVSSTSHDHGHALLISYLEKCNLSVLGRKRTLIEIGTTRESVSTQGSTEKLADLCHELRIDFITVDMDPRNSQKAQKMFDRKGYSFRAVSGKGEDFLAEYKGQIDFVFLDAYDFDHGGHSELRQSRYEKYLGNKIDEAQCHKMHLDCAISIVSKLSDHGAICFDDTWIDSEGSWTAKGTTAMPYLLEHGFQLVSAENKAALLIRKTV